MKLAGEIESSASCASGGYKCGCWEDHSKGTTTLFSSSPDFELLFRIPCGANLVCTTVSGVCNPAMKSAILLGAGK